MAAPFPSSSRMDAWPQSRGLQTMNLRSVFTAEQQRILERYYENGMINQSKSCFQLILQCAQEAKLDFSVVRTWVGNKRRKLASKADQNGNASHAMSAPGLVGGLLSNNTLTRGVLLPADVAAARTLQNRAHLHPPSSSFTSFSSASSSPSSSSPLSSGSNNNNNNNDVILTGIYSLNSHAKPKPRASSSQSDLELLAQTSSSRNTSTSSSVHAKLVSLSQNLPSSVTPASGPSVHTAVRKREVGVPYSWTRQHGAAQTQLSSSQTQSQPGPHPNPRTPSPQKPRLPHLPTQNCNPPTEQTLRIQRVFTLTEKSGKEERARSKPVPVCRSGQSHTSASVHSLSIAMETGDEEDEWQREEELANMAAHTHINNKEWTSAGPAREGVGHTPPTPGSRTALALHSNYSLTAQTSLTGELSSQASLAVSAPPWVVSNSRKRTLQDRTQFSDGDLVQLKRYWDRGMTSLGSVCREKITAAANQLNVDTEIVKTWISNRRRKYRLMGIEIPPPKGGPVVFSGASPGNESPLEHDPDTEPLRTPEPGDDFNDGGSLCLSEDETVDSGPKDRDDAADMPAPLANNVKVEVIDEDEEDDEEYEASDFQQMQNLLEFKHEEVQFLENELENQKQRYQDLANFTKSLLIAVRSNDRARQQELLASLPQPSDSECDGGPWASDSPGYGEPLSDGAGCGDSPQQQANEDVLLIAMEERESMGGVSDASASEEQLRE